MSEKLKPIDIEVPFSPQMVEERTTLGKLTSEVMGYRSRDIFIPSVFTPMVFNATVDALTTITRDPVHSRSLIWEALKREFGVEIANITFEYVDTFNKNQLDTEIQENSSVLDESFMIHSDNFLVEGVDLEPVIDELAENKQEIWGGEDSASVRGELEWDDVGENW